MSTDTIPHDCTRLAKGTLFCLACDRTAPIDDEWSLTRRSGRINVTCPDCGTVLVSQPLFDADGRRCPAIA